MNLLRRLPSSALKFAVFAVVCLVLLVGLAAKIGNLSLFSHRHALDAQLADVTGLASGDPVNIAGVPVGQVTGIAVQRGHALITMSINNSVTLHAATDVGLRWQNVIGEKEVQIFPSGAGPVLAPGAILPLGHDVSDASVNQFLNTLGPLLSSINPRQANEFVESVSGALEGDTAEIDQLLNSGAAVSNTVGALNTQVGQVIVNLNQVLTAVASRSGDLGTLVDNLQTVASSLAGKNDLLDDVVGNLSQVATDLAGLIGSNHSVITSTIDNLQAVAADVSTNQKQLSESLSSLGAGLAPYIQISQYGQWFAVQTIYTCLANQTSCSYYEPTSPPPGSGPGGSPPTSLPSAAGQGSSPTGTAPSGTGSPSGLSIGGVLGAVAGQGSGERAMKAFTERRPKVIGSIAVAVIVAGVLAILLLNRSVFSSGYTVTARFSSAAGITRGTDVMVAGVKVGSVTGVAVNGNAVDASLSVDQGVQLPQDTTAAIEVETLLGVVDVTLQPVNGWQHPLQGGALITHTTVPTELYQLQQSGQKLLSRSNAKALNSLVESLATITKGKQDQVAEIIRGLGALTTTVDQRGTQVSQLIDSANLLSSTLAAKDTELLSIVNNLDTVSTGLADHSTDLSNLITNVDQMAAQTNALVSGDSPQLNALLASLHSDLAVVGQHQDDLAEGVSYLGGALKGFASIAYAGDQGVSWGNVFVNPAGLTNTYGVIGPCGALDQALTDALGPDPQPCADQTGPLPGTSTSTSSSGDATGTSGSTDGTGGGASAGGLPVGPSSGIGGLSQLLSPLLGGKL